MLGDRRDGVSAVREFIKVEAELDKRGMDMCCFTSLGKFQLYEVDFGRGKSAWVTIPLFNDNMFVLMETRCGQGIEAWVTLEEQCMAEFEANEELLEFASVNPSAFTYDSRV